MTEKNYGNLDGRQLTLRLYGPSSMWGDAWEFSPRRMLEPRAWLRAIFNRWNWACWWRSHPRMNHRCYCCTGWMFDGRVTLAGFGITWFYSRYDGPVPCGCDQAIAELEAGCLADALTGERNIF